MGPMDAAEDMFLRKAQASIMAREAGGELADVPDPGEAKEVAERVALGAACRPTMTSGVRDDFDHSRSKGMR